MDYCGLEVGEAGLLVQSHGLEGNMRVWLVKEKGDFSSLTVCLHVVYRWVNSRE